MTRETAPALDLVLAGCTDPIGGERIDIGVAGRTIAFVRPHDGAAPSVRVEAADTVDARGWSILPPLVETHIHLDKAYLAERMPGPASGLAEAIAMTAALKAAYTPEDIAARSRRLLDRMIRSGVGLARAHAEVDSIIGLMSMEAASELRASIGHLIDLQLVAFPQEGVFSRPGTEALMREAVRMGADAVGGVPYNDRDSFEHLAFVFRLAAESGLPLDLHLDFSDDPEQLAILDVLRMTRDYGMEGRVAVGHLTSLGSAAPDVARRVADRMAEAGIAVMTLPATDLHLNGRGDSHRPRRGLAPVRLLLEAGVNVVFGTNNVRNAFTPFGTGDPLDIGLLLAQTAHMGADADAVTLLRMCTADEAKAIGATASYGLAAGHPASFTLLQGEGAADLLFDRPASRIVWRHGKCIADTRVSAVTDFEP